MKWGAAALPFTRETQEGIAGAGVLWSVTAGATKSEEPRGKGQPFSEARTKGAQENHSTIQEDLKASEPCRAESLQSKINFKKKSLRILLKKKT